MNSTFTPHSSTYTSWITRLAEQGYRISTQICILLEILVDFPRALSPIELFDLGRKKYPGLGLVTVYRTLEKLEVLGLVQRIHQSENCHLVLRAPQGHEHILICTTCGKVAFFKGDNLDPLIHDLAESTGFKIQEHWLQLNGICADCQTNMHQK